MARTDASSQRYRQLDAARLVASMTQLDGRIRDRFPDAGLARVCQDLITLTRDNTRRVAAIGRANWALRMAIALVLIASLAGVAESVVWFRTFNVSPDNVYTLVQGIDSVIHIVFVMVGAVFFLVTMEDRMKRRRALGALAELRSIIHVIDMHQLTKEPASILAGGAPTANSPKRTLTPFQLGRYLDYSAEMLSLVAKVAVLYAQSQPDPVIVDAVSDIERLTTSLSQQIWQKLMLLHANGGLEVQPSARAESNSGADGDDADA